jgi:flagellar transcriptional activator FlhC
VAHKHDLQNNVVCGACQPPSRAGKTKKAAAARQATEEAALEVVSQNEVPGESSVLDNAALFAPRTQGLVAQAA